MGGCCCCSSNEVGLNSSPAFYHYPRLLEEHEPLSSHHGTVSALSTGLLVDTNLETSIPDTYRPPPAPLPYDANARHAQSPPRNQESCGNEYAAVHTTNTQSVDETNAGNTVGTSDKDLKESDCKVKMDTDLTLSKDTEIELEKSGELKKSSEPLVSALVEEKDVCPTCLEEYDAENPKIPTKCEHHFHLACILEWMERSDTCPVCGQEMIFNHTVDG